MNQWIKFPDCNLCAGRGFVIGGDDEQQCPQCRLREGDRLAERERRFQERRMRGIS